MSPILRIVLLGVFLGALLDLISAIKRLCPMIKRINEIKRARNSYNAISVEAEIIAIQTKPLDKLDTEYDVKLYYEVGYQKFYKDFILVNKQALRIGQKLTLLCDGDDPEQAYIEEFNDKFGENYQMKNVIVNIVISILIMLADSIISAFGYINGDP